MKKLSLLCAITFLSLGIATADAQVISESHYYKKTALPGETVTFTARLRNVSSSAQLLYGAVVLTTRGTASFELYPSPAPPALLLNVGARGEMTLSVRVPEEEGSYSVSMLIFDAFTDIRILTVFGQMPLIIGDPRQSINVHPSRVNFGKLEFGRFMYPIPFKVRYKIFLPNAIGDPSPWAIRIYTDNANKFKGIPGTIRQLSPGGLVHSTGKYTIPIKFWNLNWGPDAHTTGWDAAIQGPPPVEDDRFWKGVLTDESTPDRPINDHDLKPWLSIHDYSDMTVEPDTWRRAVGFFPYDGQFLNPSNLVGDYQLSRQPDPFEFYLAVELTSTAVRGKYSGRLVLELISP